MQIFGEVIKFRIEGFLSIPKAAIKWVNYGKCKNTFEHNAYQSGGVGVADVRRMRTGVTATGGLRGRAGTGMVTGVHAQRRNTGTPGPLITSH